MLRAAVIFDWHVQVGGCEGVWGVPRLLGVTVRDMEEARLFIQSRPGLSCRASVPRRRTIGMRIASVLSHAFKLVGSHPTVEEPVLSGRTHSPTIPPLFRAAIGAGQLSYALTRLGHRTCPRWVFLSSMLTPHTDLSRFLCFESALKMMFWPPCARRVSCLIYLGQRRPFSGVPL